MKKASRLVQEEAILRVLNHPFDALPQVRTRDGAARNDLPSMRPYIMQFQSLGYHEFIQRVFDVTFILENEEASPSQAL